MVVCCGLLKSAFVTVLIKRCLKTKKKVRRRDFCLVPWFITLPEQSLPVHFKDYNLDENKGAEQVRALPASVLGRHFWTSI